MGKARESHDTRASLTYNYPQLREGERQRSKILSNCRKMMMMMAMIMSTSKPARERYRFKN